MKRAPLVIFVGLLALGAMLCGIASLWPVYIFPDAPDRLSDSLAKSHDFKEWFARLPLYETPHKRVFDYGCGLLLTGLGFGLAYAYLLAYGKVRQLRTTIGFVAVWLAVRALQAPLVGIFYEVREERFDYPVWGDSIAIGVVEDIAVGTICAFVTLPMMAVLLFRSSLPNTLTLPSWKTGFQRVRAVAIVIWMGLLLLLAASGISIGASMACCCPIAAALLFVPLCAPPLPPG